MPDIHTRPAIRRHDLRQQLEVPVKSPRHQQQECRRQNLPRLLPHRARRRMGDQLQYRNKIRLRKLDRIELRRWSGTHILTPTSAAARTATAESHSLAARTLRPRVPGHRTAATDRQFPAATPPETSTRETRRRSAPPPPPPTPSPPR